MSDLDQSLLRKLAEWSPADTPITSIYLSVDGRTRPRQSDYLIRLDQLLRNGRGSVAALGREASRSVDRDFEGIASFVRERFERSGARGLAMFSSSDAGLWEDVPVPRPVRDRVAIGPWPDLLQLEALLETYTTTCVALVDYEKARLFLIELGRIAECSEIVDEVPRRHDQGGWAQGRLQRHADDGRHKHLKHVAEELFGMLKRRPFDHLVLAGSDEPIAGLEHELHDYVRKHVRARLPLAIGASVEEVLQRALEVEETFERHLEQVKIEQIASVAATGRRGVVGLGGTLSALAEGRVSELVVAMELSLPGVACTSCGRLAEHADVCAACGAPVEAVADVVEAAVAQAFRQGCRVETISGNGALAELGGIGALFRF